MVNRIYSRDWHDHVIPVPWSGCWLWEGLTRKGYAFHTLDTKERYVHRLSWEEANGPIPPGLYICHHCDVKSCVNPEHLFAGTQQDNIDDYYSKFSRMPGVGRVPGVKTHCVNGHEYTLDNVGLQAGGKQRFCLVCRRIRDKGRHVYRDKAAHNAQSRDYRLRKKEARPCQE